MQVTEQMISAVQRQRWSRLKFWHNCHTMEMHQRHNFMRREVKLLRLGKKQLLELRQAKMN